MRVTPPGGRIVLCGDQGPTGTTLSVVDSGPGLGLSTAQRLCDRMGGTLSASPAAPTGTVMTVRLAVREPEDFGA